MAEGKIDVNIISSQVNELRRHARRALNSVTEAESFDEQIGLILKIANREIETQPDERKHLMKLVDSVVYSLRLVLLGSMGGEVLPEGFWLSELGQMIMRARIILADDELITRAEAARRIYGEASKRNLVRVKRLAETGRLTPYRDPSADPSRSGLLSEREVKRVIEQGEGADDDEG